MSDLPAVIPKKRAPKKSNVIPLELQPGCGRWIRRRFDVGPVGVAVALKCTEHVTLSFPSGTQLPCCIFTADKTTYQMLDLPVSGRILLPRDFK